MKVQTTISPIDGKPVVERQLLDEAQALSCLQRSHEAFHSWKQTPLEVRSKYILKMVENMLAKRQEIGVEITKQMGRPIKYTPNELNGFAERSRYMVKIAAATLADKQVVDEDRPGFVRFIRRDPVGTVLVIPAWNYPLLTAVNGIVPALLAGNTVLLKHSQQTPLCAERIYEAFKEAGLPDNVFQFLHMDHQVTEAVIKHPLTAFVNFTGSVVGGHQIYKAVSHKFIGCGLELGGNDPAYVRADADLEYSVENLVDGAMFNSGQCCCGIERIYVHSSLYDQFVKRFVEITNQYVLGDPMDPATTLGPMVKVSAAEFIRSMVKDAVEKGAKALIDTSRFPKDKVGTAYLAPQVLVNVNHSMQVMTEEQFGPVIGIMKVDSDQEAIKLMNDSKYGLTASIWTKDEKAAIDIGNQVETGTVFQNRCDYVDPGLAWTGVKDTGFGCTLSSYGLLQMTRPKSFHLKKI